MTLARYILTTGLLLFCRLSYVAGASEGEPLAVPLDAQCSDEAGVCQWSLADAGEPATDAHSAAAADPGSLQGVASAAETEKAGHAEGETTSVLHDSKGVEAAGGICSGNGDGDAPTGSTPSPASNQGTDSTQSPAHADAAVDSTSTSLPDAASTATAHGNAIVAGPLTDSQAPEPAVALTPTVANLTLADGAGTDERGLAELMVLLQQARQAVASLEAAVARQEQRIARLAAASAAIGSGGGVSTLGAGAGNLPPLGDAAASAAARQAFQEALRVVKAERGAAGGDGGVHVGNLQPLGSDAAGGAGEWLGTHFALRSVATAAGAAVTCAFPYELPHPNAAASGGGALQYIAVGDAAGMLYILSAVDGRPLAALPTGAGAAVTACTAYHIRRSESVVVTGHADGQTRSFTVHVQEAPAAPPSSEEQQQQRRRQQRDPHGGGAAAMNVVVQAMTLRHVVRSMPPGALPWAAVEELIGPAAAGGSGTLPAAAAEGVVGTPAAAAAAADGGTGGYMGPPAPIMHILPYKQGHKVGGRRHVLVLDRAGNMRLERDNGTLRFWARTNRTQLAVRFVGNYAVMLSSQHATLVNTLQPRSPRAFVCQHLNGSRMLAASFDGTRSFRGYAVNTRAELVSLVTPHEGRLTACKAHRATPLPGLDPASLSGPAPPASLSLTPFRGYLLLTHGSRRLLLNVTGVAPARTGPPAVAAAADPELASLVSALAAASPALTGAAAADADATAATPAGTAAPPAPVVAVAPGSQMLVLALPSPAAPLAPEGLKPPGDAAAASSPAAPTPASGGAAGGAGLLLVMDSRLPRVAVPATGGLWGQPVFIVAMLLVGLYQFWRLSNSRTQRRAAGPGRSMRSRRAHGVHGTPPYGSGAYGGDEDDHLYGGGGGSGRVPLQPRSALRRDRSSSRPTGRSVTYQDPLTYVDSDY